MSKTIKISDENYSLLAEFAGRLQTARKKPVSMDVLIDFLRNKQKAVRLIKNSKLFLTL
jgi:hypothetical protein